MSEWIWMDAGRVYLVFPGVVVESSLVTKPELKGAHLESR